MPRPAVLVIVLVALWSAAAGAIELPDDRRWVVVASRESAAEAIAIAAEREQEFAFVMVVKSVNGLHGVVVGLDQDAGGIIGNGEQGSLPADAYAADPTRYTDVIWCTQALRLELFFVADR